MNKEIQKRAEKLKQEIQKHNYNYYVLDNPTISNDMWDSMMRELIDLEEKYPELYDPNSPTKRIGDKVLKSFKKHTHTVRMASLDDKKTKEDMLEWEKRNKRMLNKDFEYYVEYKYDGLSLSLIYENNNLTIGATRGNGKIGEDVTQNIRTIKTIPLSLPSKEILIKRLKEFNLNDIAKYIENNKINKIEVRGEVVLTKQEFFKLNKQQEKENKPIYANPRNVAAGSIRQLDSKITATRKLSFYPWDIVTFLGQKTHSQEHLILEVLGFKSNYKINKICKNIKEVFDFYTEVSKSRDKIDYEIDGLVVRINNNNDYKELGDVAKGPRGATAFKFPAKEAITVVQDIQVQVGRTGILTPVAFLKPVVVGGVTVSRATLHNKEEIKRLGLKINDTVVLIRSGDVIPKIIKVLKEFRTKSAKEFKMPTTCPECNTKVIFEDILVKCPNINCPARNSQQIKHFISKKGFDMKGVGFKLIEKLIDLGLIVDFADLFSLTEGDIKPIERQGEKSAKNIINAIQNSKKIELSRFIFSLGIPLVGEDASVVIAQHLSSNVQTPKDLINTIKDKKIDYWNSIYDFGNKVSKQIYEYFNNPKNIELLNKLNSHGIKFIQKELSSTKLKNKSFLFTGTLSKSREYYQNLVKDNGGTIKNTIVKDLSFLVVGDSPGSKLEKAKKLNISILSEQEFLKLLK
jgi:DNA ligase (NAD+)